MDEFSVVRLFGKKRIRS